MKWLLAISISVGLAALVACSGPNTATPTTTTAPITGTTNVPTTTAPGGVSFGQLADAGKAIFAAKCSACHGNNGQGVTAPAVIGANAQLAKYRTAQGLLSFIDTNMPFNAPGSLSQAQYLQVLSYLLVQNQDVAVTTLFINEGELGAINLK